MQIAPGSMLTPSLKAGLRPLPVLALNGPQYLTIRGDVRHCRSSMSLTISASKAKLLPTRRSPGLICRSAYDAASTTASTPPPAEKKESILLLGVLFAGWYGANTYFNIANKTVLKNAPLPFSFTNLQFAVGGVLALLMWTFKLHERPKVSTETLKAIVPLAAVHTLGNLLTNVSLGKVAVSFTHTIKSMEPFFSVLLSSIFLGDTPSIPVLLSLVPIVGGVVAASASEATFNWPGFLAAMGSNVTFQSRNVFSKKFMGNKKGALDNINLFSIITIMSFFLLAPFTLAKEGFQLTHQGLSSIGVANTNYIFRQALYAALSFHTYQQVSYMILQRVSPVTHSIGNCLKRVIVIVASVIFFQNPVSRQNIIGTSVALAGVFIYSQVKRSANKQKLQGPAP